MFHETWLPGGLHVNLKDHANVLSVSAQIAHSRELVRVLVVNNYSSTITTTLKIIGWQANSVEWSTLTASSLCAANAPGTPQAVKPVRKKLQWKGQNSVLCHFEAYSVNSLLLM